MALNFLAARQGGPYRSINCNQAIRLTNVALRPRPSWNKHNYTVLHSVVHILPPMTGGDLLRIQWSF